MWKDKNTDKHKCNFEKHYILKVIDKNNFVQYYNVMKCNQCLSFKSISEKGNIQGHVLKELTAEQKRLSVIVGYCKHYYRITFANLENVFYDSISE